MPADLDPTIAALADAAAQWLVMAAMTAQCLGVTTPVGIAAMMPRVASGYQPKAVRTEVAHRSYRDGLAKPPARETAAGRHAAEVARWYS